MYQSEGARASESCMHDGSDCHRGRDVFSLHGTAGTHERVPGAGTQRAERRTQVALLPLRVHWGDGKGLHLCGDAAP